MEQGSFNLVNLEFCEIYKNLIIDIFNKTKIDFIDEKLIFIKQSGSFRYDNIFLHCSNELIEVDNTMVPRDYLGKNLFLLIAMPLPKVFILEININYLEVNN